LIAAGLFASPDQVACELQLDRSRPIVLFCQHSVTTEFEQATDQVRPSLAALGRLAEEGWQVVATFPNNDAGGRHIIEEMKTLDGVPGIVVRKSLGRFLFHGLLNVIGRVGRGAFAGNSSAGIKETPAFGCPVVNIGSRQQGRLRATNVLDVPYDAEAIEAALRRSVTDEAFRRQCATCENPYGAGNAGSKITEVLATIPIDRDLLRKRMTY
jgi:UDP-N-acetylglucosamine 2-epimerase